MVEEYNSPSEEEVKFRLTSWLSKYGFQVYWEKKNKWEFPVFKTDNRNRPDLLVIKDDSYCSIIEVKRASDGHGIKMGSKILDYYSDYVSGKTKYYIDDKLVKPKCFLQATECSVDGRLYYDDVVKPPSEERIRAIGICATPEIEYVRGFDHIRSLWEEWRRRELVTPPYMIGLLLGDVCGRPEIFCQRFNENSKWVQCVFKIWRK